MTGLVLWWWLLQHADPRYGMVDGHLFGSYPGIQVALRKLDYPVPPDRLPELLAFAKQLEAAPSAQSAWAQWASVYRSLSSLLKWVLRMFYRVLGLRMPVVATVCTTDLHHPNHQQ